jgi:hypothetical protein
MIFQQVILAEYEKLVGKEESVPSVRSATEPIRLLEQLKTDGLINEEEYNTKRKEISGKTLVPVSRGAGAGVRGRTGGRLTCSAVFQLLLT